MAAVARLADPLSCGDVVAGGSGNVFINGMPASRVGVDLTAGHCFLPTVLIPGGANLGTVFVNGIPLAVTGDTITHTCPPIPATHNGAVATGSPDVKAY